jgi:hypothetical protein
LRFVFHPLSRTHFFITNANPACSCVYICKFQFRPIHPPLGDYQNHNFELLRKPILPDSYVPRAQLSDRPTRECLFSNPARDDMR